MKKTLDYLYIFSKLSTSIILFLSLIALGYFFYLSFKNHENSNNDQIDLFNKLNQNSEKLSTLTKQIKITDTSLNEIQKYIQNNTNDDSSEDITLLSKKIEEIDLSIKNISTNLQKIQNKNTSDSNDSNKNNTNNISNLIVDNNKSQIVKLIIYKFENNLDFSEEINILQSFNDNKNQYIFEKINLIQYKKFRGVKFIKKIYSQELNFYLKEKFNKKHSSFISKSLMKFVAIEPSKKNIIKNTEINMLNEISGLLDKKNFKIAYEKITNIANYEKYFQETIDQIQVVNEFKELIKKIK